MTPWNFHCLTIKLQTEISLFNNIITNCYDYKLQLQFMIMNYSFITKYTEDT